MSRLKTTSSSSTLLAAEPLEPLRRASPRVRFLHSPQITASRALSKLVARAYRLADDPAQQLDHCLAYVRYRERIKSGHLAAFTPADDAEHLTMAKQFQRNISADLAHHAKFASLYREREIVDDVPDPEFRRPLMAQRR